MAPLLTRAWKMPRSSGSQRLAGQRGDARRFRIAYVRRRLAARVGPQSSGIRLSIDFGGAAKVLSLLTVARGLWFCQIGRMSGNTTPDGKNLNSLVEVVALRHQDPLANPRLDRELRCATWQPSRQNCTRRSSGSRGRVRSASAVTRRLHFSARSSPALAPSVCRR